MIELSIVIPHFNNPEKLEKLLKTIPMTNEVQTIVIDDQSSIFLEDYKKLTEKFNHVNFAKNTTGVKGAGSCRNLGINLAEGKWLLFADSDDYFLEGFYDVVKEYFDTENDIVFFRPTSYDEDSHETSDRHIFYEKIISEYISNDDNKGKLMLRYSFHVPWSKLFKTDFIKENKIYFDEVIAANDVMFSVKSGHLMRIFDVNQKIIYCVTKNKGSLTMDMTEKVFDSRLQVHIRYYQFLNCYLTNDELKLIGIVGSFEYIRLAIFNRYGIKKVLDTYSKIRKSGLQVFSVKYINPIFVVNKIIFYIKFYKKNTKYMKKRNQ